MKRLLEVDTPLGKEAFHIRSFAGTERLGRLFQYELELLTKDADLSLDDIVGEDMTVSLELPDDKVRYFHGHVSQFTRIDYHQDYAVFRVTLSPWFWFLTRTADCRIFQEMKVPDIIKEVFREHGFTDFEEELSGEYRQWEYCVQYRETDFNFVSRLLEQEGMYYYFKHEDGRHTLVLSDSYSAHSTFEGFDQVKYFPPSTEGIREKECIYDWSLSKSVQSGNYVYQDFNFKKPRTNLLSPASIARQHANADYEIFDYPGEYVDAGEGETYSRIRIEELHAQHEVVSGEANARGLHVGSLFTLDGYPSSGQNIEHLVTSVVHHVINNDPETDDGEPASYTCRFTAMDSQQPFRAARTTPKPSIQGPQTAVVVGKEGEELWTDEYGRVKCQFHWDRYGESNQDSSCWIRVAQVWAGKSWGAMYIPRIGHEVIVEFLEGDPDRPIITGRVYNGDNMPPYGLPGEATKSTIKSNSSKGGGGFNELRFEDKAGSEEIFLHGQKDWTISILNDKNQTVGHDETHSVGNNRDKSVANDQSESIGNNKKVNVGTNHSEAIGSDKDLTVGANHTESIGANMSLNVGQNQTINVGSNKTETVTINTAETIGAAKELTIGAVYQVTVGAAMNETIAAAKMEEIGAIKSVNVGANSSENVGGNKSVDAGGSISETAGKSVAVSAGADVAVTSGKKMNLSAGDDFAAALQKKGVIDIADEFTIKCGSASISMKKNGDIAIKGKNINVKGSGDVVIKGSKINQN